MDTYDNLRLGVRLPQDRPDAEELMAYLRDMLDDLDGVVRDIGRRLAALEAADEAINARLDEIEIETRAYADRAVSEAIADHLAAYHIGGGGDDA